MAATEITPSLLKLFPTFDGETITLDQYLETFNRILSAFSLNKVKGYKILSLTVRGKAEIAYRTARRSGKVWDYQSLVTELGTLLATEGSRIKAKYGLALEMKEGEEIGEFADRIRRNILKAYPEFAETHQESLMADSFTRGCTPQLRWKLMKHTYPTLTDAQEKAELIMTQLQMNEQIEKETKTLGQKVDALSEALQRTGVKKEEVNYTGKPNQLYQTDRRYVYESEDELNDPHHPENEWNEPRNDQYHTENDWTEPRNNQYHPKNDWIEPRNNQYHPKNDWIEPRNNQYHPENDWTEPRNNQYHPKNDWIEPRNNQYHPENDWTEPRRDQYHTEDNWNEPRIEQYNSENHSGHEEIEDENANQWRGKWNNWRKKDNKHNFELDDWEKNLLNFIQGSSYGEESVDEDGHRINN